MDATLERLKRLKVDALYGKKKHFNASDRLQACHYWLGIPLLIVSIATGSVLFYVLLNDSSGVIKFVPLVLALVAALLSGFQTFFNFARRVEAHRRLGNRYLAIVKSVDRTQAFIRDELISNDQFVQRVEAIGTEIADINRDAEGFPTSKKDYQKAKVGIEAGEESYTAEELEM